MSTSYQDNQTAQEYSKFTNSENGKIQQQVIWTALEKYLVDNTKNILDVACGNGWLSNLLFKKGFKLEACDFSEGLLNEAKKQAPEINFKLADLNSTLPYADSAFDAVVFNMAAHDVKNLQNAFNEISRVIKVDGKILMTVANPYYSFPVGIWKRGLIGFLLRQLPKLKLTSYNDKKNQTDRGFVWNNSFQSYFYTLPEYLAAAKTAGLTLERMEDLESKIDDVKFNLNYQLSRFPIILLLVFKKTLK